MMVRAELALLCDIGSTYTKLAAVELSAGRLVASASSLTTTEDVSKGFQQALDKLQAKLPAAAEFTVRRAASSAAGGLKLVAIGLVRDLTGEAARLAALGAGAKVQAVFSHRLQAGDLEQLRRLQPDIVLLAGGTDGGDDTILLHNAGGLAVAELEAAVVVAGNREVAPEAVSVLQSAGIEAVQAENVMPRLGETAVDDARDAIRRLFLRRIVRAKGLQQLCQQFSLSIAMPTPVAVLQALELLAETEGELLAVDVGGSTTDVYSLALGQSDDDHLIPTGLRPPYAYRSVEADLGMRASADSLAARYGQELRQKSDQAGLRPLDWSRWCAMLAARPAWVAEDNEAALREQVLARVAVQQAVDRHVGRLQPFATPFGRSWLLRGKDLRKVKYVIGIGGIFRHALSAESILAEAGWNSRTPDRLKPVEPICLFDRDYVLSAAGLLAEVNPQSALALMRHSLGLA